jgi:hypothetical protein
VRSDPRFFPISYRLNFEDGAVDGMPEKSKNTPLQGQGTSSAGRNSKRRVNKDERLRRKVGRLRDALPSLPPGAIWEQYRALIAIGHRAVEFVPSVVDELLVVSRKAGREYALFAVATAHLAPDRRDVFERVLGIAVDTTRDLRTNPDFPGHTFDYLAPIRGEAITALGLFQRFAVDAIAPLIAAIDNFEEYDSDETYELGDHGRAIGALRDLLSFRYDDTSPPALSAEVASALLPHLAVLISHISGSDGDTDYNIIRLLGQLGTIAADAIPVLEPLDDSDEEYDPSDTFIDTFIMDTVKYALYRIRGGGHEKGTSQGEF